MYLSTFYVDKSRRKFVLTHPITAYKFGGTAPLTLSLAALPWWKNPRYSFNKRLVERECQLVEREC